MTKPSYSRPSSYFYGMPDVYMQMGYYPFPTPPAPEQIPMNVHVPYAMSMASQSKYYMGQTERIVASDNDQGFGALSNPLRSHSLLYVQNWSITNSSAQPLTIHIWFGRAESIVGGKTSQQVTSGFVQPPPCPAAQGQLLFGRSGGDITREGIAVSTRIVPPMTTIEGHANGQWILGPGMALMVYAPQSEEATSFFFSVDWWEQPGFG
ncbi:DUF6143 family protein [Brevibacillus reuszeri]|uniref:DUF6143 family protein n=1 Tax=Brevibacillus reuszeri TaxID=54915 RepID=UPI00289D0D5C|nr:DUF6143 family protein [Brevibacillus reuszeri]